jgi:hypothetical protein
MSRAPEPPRPGNLRSPHASQGDRSGSVIPAPLALCVADFAPRTDALREDLLRRMRAWASPVVARLLGAGLAVAAQAMDGPDAQCLVFSGEARMVLALSVDAERVRAGLDVPAARARGVRLALSSPERALEVGTALEALPEQFEVAVEGGAPPLPAPQCTVDDLRSMLDRAAQENKPLWIGWTVPRDVAVQHSSLLDEQLTDSLVVLARVLTLLSGAVDDAHAAAAAGRSTDRKKRGSRRAEDDGDRTKRSPRDTSAHPADKDRARERHARPSIGSDRDADGGDAEADPPGARPTLGRPLPRFGARGLRSEIGPKSDAERSRASRRRHDVVERGAHVRVLDGPFAGKVGVVQELDGRGGARVMMGLLAVRIDMTNLEVHAEGRRRPVLSTSHRKPIPARS